MKEQLRTQFNAESLIVLKPTQVKTKEDLEQCIVGEVKHLFFKGKAASLSNLNKRYGQLCLKITNLSLANYLQELIAAGKIFILLNSNRASRIVPAEDWLENYELAQEKGDDAVEKLNQMYLED